VLTTASPRTRSAALKPHNEAENDRRIVVASRTGSPVMITPAVARTLYIDSALVGRGESLHGVHASALSALGSRPVQRSLFRAGRREPKAQSRKPKVESRSREKRKTPMAHEQKRKRRLSRRQVLRSGAAAFGGS